MQGTGRSGQFAPRDYHFVLEAARTELNQGQFQAARNLFAESLSLFPQSLESLVGLGHSFIENDQADLAVAPLASALGLSYYDASLHALMGRALTLVGRTRDAAREIIVARIFGGDGLADQTSSMLVALPRSESDSALEEVKRLGLAQPFDERGRQTTTIPRQEALLDPEEEGRRIADVDYWHHEFILPSGRKIPGRAGNMLLLGMLGLPESLAGKKVLDVAAWDGFLSYECEARGARSVTALDWLVWRYPDIGDHGFLTMHEVLGSSVKQVLCDAYDMDNRRLGLFDVTIMCGLLYHLHDPLRALQALASVTGEVAYIGNTIMDRGECESLARYSLTDNNHYNDFTTWWVPNTRCMMEMVLSSGFERAEVVARSLDASTGHGYMVVKAYPKKASFRDFYLGEHPFLSHEAWPDNSPLEAELIGWSTGQGNTDDGKWLDAEVLEAIKPANMKAAFFNLRNNGRNEEGIRLAKSWLRHNTNYELEGIVRLYETTSS